MSSDNILDAEAQAFDNQIIERIENGHIPDLRRVEECDWFRVNSWRKPYFVDLDFGEIFRKIDCAIKTHIHIADRPIRVLEIGCGPGYISLELARSGYDTIGLELSTECINIAQKYAEEDPWKATRASLDYITGDIFSDDTLNPEKYHGYFDVVVMVGALHHFPDQKAILAKVNEVLGSGGIVLAHEPTRDRASKSTTMLHYLVKTLVSAGGNYREPEPLPETRSEFDGQLMKLHQKLTYEEEDGQKSQSPNDNEAGYEDMVAALNNQFEKLALEDTYAFYHELIGGFDFDDETNKKLGWVLRELDHELVKEGAIIATEFFYIGRSMVLKNP